MVHLRTNKLHVVITVQNKHVKKNPGERCWGLITCEIPHTMSCNWPKTNTHFREFVPFKHLQLSVILFQILIALNIDMIYNFVFNIPRSTSSSDFSLLNLWHSLMALSNSRLQSDNLFSFSFTVLWWFWYLSLSCSSVPWKTCTPNKIQNKLNFLTELS